MSSSGGSRFFQYMFIVLFSASVVAIGAKELHKKYLSKRKGLGKTAQELIDELHGDVDIKHASVSPKFIEDASRRQQAPAPHAEEQTMDKKSLNNLINKLVP